MAILDSLMLMECLVCCINAGQTFQKALDFQQVMEATRTGLRSLLLRLEKQDSAGLEACKLTNEKCHSCGEGAHKEGLKDKNGGKRKK